MAQYMFSVHSVDGGGGPEKMTQEEMQQGWQKISILESHEVAVPSAEVRPPERRNNPP